MSASGVLTGFGAASGTVLGERRGRRAARSWNPAAAVPSRSTPAASPVVAARAVPDMVATRTERTDGEGPAHGAVAGDVHEMVEPEQQRPDGDGDGRQHPVAVPGDDDDDGQDEGGHQLDDRGGGNGPLDAFGFGAGRPAARPGGDPDAVGQDGDGDDQAGCGQDGPGPAADVEGAADQPEGGKGQLDEASHSPDPLRPGGPGQFGTRWRR